MYEKNMQQPSDVQNNSSPNFQIIHKQNKLSDKVITI